MGNEALSDLITNQPEGNFRVTHTIDPVPRIAPPLSSEYVHISPEYWIWQDSDGSPVSPSDVRVLTGSVNQTGNSGTTGGLDLASHVQYLGPIAACGPGFLTPAANGLPSATTSTGGNAVSPILNQLDAVDRMAGNPV